MLIKTHLAFGIFLYLILFKYTQSWWLFLIGVIIGVVLLDIDSKKSNFGRLIIFRPIQLIISHRGITHSIFFGFILTVLIGLINLDISFGFLVGFASHILLDILTPLGVPLFYPLTKKRIRFRIKSGGIIEIIIFVLILIIDIILLIKIII